MYPPHWRWLFIYGSLKTGKSNHHWMVGAHFHGKTLTAPNYTLYDLGQWPALLSAGHTAVHGELYTVSPGHLLALDYFEGHPREYRRAPVFLHPDHPGAHLRVETYFYQRPVDHAAPVLTGDWKGPPHEVLKGARQREARYS